MMMKLIRALMLPGYRFTTTKSKWIISLYELKRIARWMTPLPYEISSRLQTYLSSITRLFWEIQSSSGHCIISQMGATVVTLGSTERQYAGLIVNGNAVTFSPWLVGTKRRRLSDVVWL